MSEEAVRESVMFYQSMTVADLNKLAPSVRLSIQFFFCFALNTLLYSVSN